MHPHLDSYQNLICSPRDDKDKGASGRRWDDDPQLDEPETVRPTEARDTGEASEADQAAADWPTRLQRNEKDDRQRAADGEPYEDQADNAIFPPKHTDKTVKTPKRP